MSEIHYFPRYSQPENVVTNNTLLLLLRLHQYNRFKFEKFMDSICAEQQDFDLSSSWLHFSQQKSTGKSVIDGFIAQESIKIAVETKLTEVFRADQLGNHLALFRSEQHKVLVLLSPSLGDASSQQLQALREVAAKKNIQVLHTSFEDIVENSRACLSEHDEEMLALVDDYESFCSDSDLLPRDKYTLFVPPCGQSFDDTLHYNLYYCPATWSRRKARYLGIYKDKSVRAIGEIVKVVACDVNMDANLVTVAEEQKNLTDDEKQRILGAAKNAEARDWDLSTGFKFFLCDALEETDFCKTSSGGIMGHRYFDLEDVLGSTIPGSLGELASCLRGRTWE